MSRSDSWKTWGVVIGVLLVTGILAATWPLILGLLTELMPTSAVPRLEPQVFEINVPPLPVVLTDGLSLSLAGWQVILGIAVVVIGLVAVTGFVIALINVFLSRLSTAVVESESYQKSEAELQKKEKAKLRQLQDGRASDSEQQNDYSRWNVVATSLAILMFAAFAGFLVADTFFPDRYVVRNDQVVNITLIIVGIFVLTSLLVLLWRLNPQRLEAAEEQDTGGIPWDTIVVIVSGVLVVGLGIGLVIYFNIPSG